MARAAPVLLGDVAGLPSGAEEEALDALDRALEAARQVDVHTALLLARPRARLATDIDAARARAERGEADAAARLGELERERDELAEASLAHDLAAREALVACETITRALSDRVEELAIGSGDPEREWREMLAA